MKVNFIILGRLGNAIFRYLASITMCILYDGEYVVNENQSHNCTDELFDMISNNFIKSPENILSFNNTNIAFNMSGYYQHDTIYKKLKSQIIEYISNHKEHYVLTDGVNAGDRNYQQFYMNNILNTPPAFNKKYKNVLHVRLEDFVNLNMFLPVERIINLLDKNIVNDELCIVCKSPTSQFEKDYISTITEHLKAKNIQSIVESNDVLTDYYILKEADTLICSKSTLSWCAAYFSNSIKQCYLPEYNIQPGIMTCKYPINNTSLY
jgi:hypothetical protein